MVGGARSFRTISLDERTARAFHERYPSADLEPTPLLSIPPAVVEHFERKGMLHIPRHSYAPGKFSSCALIRHDGEDGLTYAVTLQKTYANDGKTEQIIYLADVEEHGLFAGYGEVRFPTPPYEPRRQRHFPFVGYTETFPEFRRQGLGTRRLLVMNALTHAASGLPLQSDTLIVKNARRLWEHLVEKGLACRVGGDPTESYYRFT